MFKMQFQTLHKPVHRPSIATTPFFNSSNQLQRDATTLLDNSSKPLVISNSIAFGRIFAPMVSKGPCPSCG